MLWLNMQYTLHGTKSHVYIPKLNLSNLSSITAQPDFKPAHANYALPCTGNSFLSQHNLYTTSIL